MAVLEAVTDIRGFTLVPEEYKRKDPRQIAYHYPNEIRQSESSFIAFNKYMSQFIYYHSLQVAENMAKTRNQILVPQSCLHWRRKEHLESRCVPIGRKTFYTMSPGELKSSERKKLLEYLQSEGLI